MEPIPAEAIVSGERGEGSAAVRARVVRARQRQRARGQRVPNGRLDAADLRQHVRLDSEALECLRAGIRAHALSGRAATRLCKVARTIADLEDSADVGEVHVAEALGFRPAEGLR